MVHRPNWYRDGYIFVSFAPTVGINKDGDELFKIDEQTGQRTTEPDDKVKADVQTLINGGQLTETSRWVPADNLGARLQAVPNHFDDRYIHEMNELLDSPKYSEFEPKTVGEMIADKELIVSNGHGSPSADLRNGTIPYIKVSDLRAGQVNINPTNRVSRAVASKYWKSTESDMRPFDLLTPGRASKNIGDFSILMPGQQDVVLTKEILVFRATQQAKFDQFFILWALSLKAVRNQWNSKIFMQTNREDVGQRYHEIILPYPKSRTAGMEISESFREYYKGIENLRVRFLREIDSANEYHVFLGRSSE